MKNWVVVATATSLNLWWLNVGHVATAFYPLLLAQPRHVVLTKSGWVANVQDWRSRSRRDFHRSVTVAELAATVDSHQVQQFEYALLFDCDGVILETEELHRLAYNEAFRKFGLTIDGEPVVWSVPYYDKLQNTVGGGKPKMFYHFRNTTMAFPDVSGQAAPVTMEEQQALIDDLQAYKTEHFTTLLETQAQARPGVLDLMDAALADPTIAVGVCSAATKAAAVKTLDITLGPDRVNRLNVCILGDDVSAKKPDPLIYNTARERLGIDAEKCIVIEDSLVGLRAAVGANMKCIITYTSSTADQDFYAEGAAAKLPDLGSRHVTLAAIFDPLRKDGKDADILVGLKD